MADISQLEVNGTTYDICDATARDSLSQFQTTVQDTYLPLTGGTLTDAIIVDNNFNRSAIYKKGPIDINTPPSSGTVYESYVAAMDVNGDNLSYLQAYHNSSDRIGTILNSTRTVNGSSVYNGITFEIDASGNRSVALSTPLAFRNALGASSGIWPVSLGGTGASSVASALSNLNIKSTSCTRKLGSGGNAYAFRVGNLLIVAGKYTGCSVSSTYDWTVTAQFTLSNLGISSITCLGCYADVSGGGPSYQGSTNVGADISSNTVRIQTTAAFESKSVRFICIGYCS